MTVPTATSPLEWDSCKPEIVIGAGELGIDDVVALATGSARPRLSDDAAFTRRIEAWLRVFTNALAAERPVYGETTGVCSSVENMVPDRLRPAAAELRDRVREQVESLIEDRRLDRDIGIVRMMISEGLFDPFASDLDR